MNKNVYLTQISRFTISPNQIRDVTKFLTQYRNLITINEVHKEKLFSRKTLTKSVLSDMFTRCHELGKSDSFAVINIPKTIKNIPELLTYSHVPIDVMQFKDINPLYHRSLSSSSFNDKIILNVTPWMTGEGNITNIQGLHTIAIRDILVRSYFLFNSVWINAAFVKEASKYYGRIISSTIGRTYNLSFTERNVVSSLFSYFFISKCMIRDNAYQFLQANEKYFGFDKSDIEQVGVMIAEYKNKDMSLIDICNMVKQINPSRLKTFSFKVLSTKIRGWDLNIYTSNTALEFPPLFIFLLISNVSGRKSSISFELKKLYMDTDVKLFTEKLVKTDILYAGL